MALKFINDDGKIFTNPGGKGLKYPVWVTDHPEEPTEKNIVWAKLSFVKNRLSPDMLEMEGSWTNNIEVFRKRGGGFSLMSTFIG